MKYNKYDFNNLYIYVYIYLLFLLLCLCGNPFIIDDNLAVIYLFREESNLDLIGSFLKYTNNI